MVDVLGKVSVHNHAWSDGAAGDPLFVAGELVDPAHAPAGVADVARGLRSVLAGTLGELRVEYAESDEDGARWLALEAHALSGTPRAAVVTRRDVTAERGLAGALKQSEAELRTLLEQFPEGMSVHRDGLVVWANRALLDRLGVDASTIIGKPITTLLHPDDAPGYSQSVRAVRESGAPAAWQECRLQRADGTSTPAEAQSSAVHFAGQPAIVTLWRDLTESRELLSRMLQADRMQTMGLLTASLGHEINNPMSLVAANVDVALRAAKGLQAQLQQSSSRHLAPEVYELATSVEAGLRDISEALTDARQGARRVRSVVQDLRAFSRPENLEDGPVRLESVLEAALGMAWNEIRHRARLVKDYADVPSVLGNEARLGQVFLNLFTNAAHAIPEGAADRNEIRVRLYATLDSVVTEISDTGSGIAPEHLSRIFEPFFTTKPAGQGTGLGLPICREIVRRLGGDLELESRAGAGTTVRVRLRASDERSRPVSTLAPLTPPRQAVRVLVVDDEALIGRAVARCLGKTCSVEEAASGQAALERLRRSDAFDVILLDVMMPEMSGIDVYETLRREVPELLPRVVFLTGGAFTPLARQFLEQVPNVHVEKPFDPATLRDVVARIAALSV